MSNAKTGVELIAEERREQIEVHELTIEHDIKEEPNKTLIEAASYLLQAYIGVDNDDWWPKHWEQEWRDKFDKKTGIESLKVAGALIAAEIDRLNNLSK